MVEGSTGMEGKWVTERVWVMEAMESSLGVGAGGGIVIVCAGSQVPDSFRNNSAWAAQYVW